MRPSRRKRCQKRRSTSSRSRLLPAVTLSVHILLFVLFKRASTCRPRCSPEFPGSSVLGGHILRQCHLLMFQCGIRPVPSDFVPPSPSAKLARSMDSQRAKSLQFPPFCFSLSPFSRTVGIPLTEAGSSALLPDGQAARAACSGRGGDGWIGVDGRRLREPGDQHAAGN